MALKNLFKSDLDLRQNTKHTGHLSLLFRLSTSPLPACPDFDLECNNHHCLPPVHFANPVQAETVFSSLMIPRQTNTLNSSMSSPSSFQNEHINELHHSPVTEVFSRQHCYNQGGNTASAQLTRESQTYESPIPEPQALENGKSSFDFGYLPPPAVAHAYDPTYQRNSSLLRVPSPNCLEYSEHAQRFYEPQSFKPDSQTCVWPYHQFPPSNIPNQSYSTGALTPAQSDLGSSIITGVPYSQGSSSATIGSSPPWDTSSSADHLDVAPHRSPSASTLRSIHGSSVYGSTARSSNSSLHDTEPDPNESDVVYTQNESIRPLSPYGSPIIYQDASRLTGNSTSLSEPYYECNICRHTSTSQELLAKHQLKHQKLHRCRVQGCPRTEGFTTTNDRDRHEKSVHKTPGTYFRCMDETCTSFLKMFARRDNLKDHLKRMHRMEGIDEAEANEKRNQLADEWKFDLSGHPGDRGSSSPSPPSHMRLV